MGRVPQDPSRLTGHRKHTPFRLVKSRPAPQPKLPGAASRWPEQTRVWWRIWGADPLAADFTDIDWNELLLAATLHAMVWNDKTPATLKMKAYAELRQRVAKFGATPSDRQHLRITFATADIEEGRAEAAQERKGARSRRGPHVAAVPDEAAEAD
jgi:hypothetical protein